MQKFQLVQSKHYIKALKINYLDIFYLITYMILEILIYIFAISI